MLVETSDSDGSSFWIQLLTPGSNQCRPWEAAGSGSNDRVSAIHMGDLDWIPCFWLQPSPVLGFSDIWSSEPAGGNLLCSCLGLWKKEKIIFKYSSKCSSKASFWWVLSTPTYPSEMTAKSLKFLPGGFIYIFKAYTNIYYYFICCSFRTCFSSFDNALWMVFPCQYTPHSFLMLCSTEVSCYPTTHYHHLNPSSCQVV